MKIPERSAKLAADNDATRPDLIGLQEAVLVRTQFPADGPATPATTVALDYVQLLLDALAARGLSYSVVNEFVGLDVELPSALGFDVRHTDREVILARTDARTSELKLSNAQQGAFTLNCVIPGGALVPPTTIRRGWVSVDAKVRGTSFRFISTHLDGDCLPFAPVIQQVQAAQVLAGPASTELPVVFVGDFNSPADGSGPTYNALITAGWSDAWTMAGTGPGLSCCQANDLLNPSSLATIRIDFVMMRGGFAVRHATIVGDEPADRTPSGLWPSDHAGVAVELGVPRE
jgi:endonuclease/exonuclease/phosphatase family metal-dependent hydrolase